MAFDPVFQQIKFEIGKAPVVIFMEGTPEFPQSGFSAGAVHVFSTIGVPVRGVNTLLDPAVAQGICKFTGWPNLPQIFVKGEFIGSTDIAREMLETGELQQLLANKGVIRN